MLPPESAFCSNHDRKRKFLGVLNRRFETTFIRKGLWTQQRFALTTFENADFGLKKVKHKRTLSLRSKRVSQR